MLLGKNEESNRLLFLAVDQTLDPQIESSSYCLLSSNLLSAGDLELAIRTSRRGLATAVTAQQKQSAALNLARAYLLSDDPFSANNVIFANRDSFSDDSAKHLASLLGAYARFIGLKNKSGMLNARNRLFRAIATIPDSEYASFADGYFAAHALQELGFVEKAIDKYLLALSRPDLGSWQNRLLYELALAHRRTGQTDEAMSIFQTLTDENNDQWYRRALHQIAEIHVANRQNKASIEVCRKLWQAELNEQEKQATLQVLGVAYQQQGEHYSAALCFAGILPDSL
jgi:tetratricopeptide (TPR) repeat protein